jgi:hypothetical protein
MILQARAVSAKRAAVPTLVRRMCAVCPDCPICSWAETLAGSIFSVAGELGFERSQSRVSTIDFTDIFADHRQGGHFGSMGYKRNPDLSGRSYRRRLTPFGTISTGNRKFSWSGLEADA